MRKASDGRCGAAAPTMPAKPFSARVPSFTQHLANEAVVCVPAPKADSASWPLGNGMMSRAASHDGAQARTKTAQSPTWKNQPVWKHPPGAVHWTRGHCSAEARSSRPPAAFFENSLELLGHVLLESRRDKDHLQSCFFTQKQGMFIFGSRTFVPISWMCKKQTSISHSSTESEFISLDAELRMDGLCVLDLWDVVIEVVRSTNNTARHGKPAQGDLCRTGEHSINKDRTENINWNEKARVRAIVKCGLRTHQHTFFSR